MTKEDNKGFNNSTKCWICANDYVDNDVKIRDHCHVTGKYRGSAYRYYNINLKLNHKIHVVFHNSKMYDSHLIMQELRKFNLEINVIPNGLEKYMSFTINNKLSFIGSFQFLISSLDIFVKNFNKDDNKYLSQEFDNNVLDLVKQKGFYSYEYMTDFEKFKEELPRKERFYSSLTDKKITDKKFEHILNVWKKVEMKTMKDYHNLYLKCDVLLLADVFEKLRDNSLKNYGSCPSHYLSAPGLIWDAMLNMRKVKLELNSDPDMYIFFEQGMRDRVSYISNRYSKANNRCLEFYDPKQESKHITCIDANNLHGHAMSMFLATSGFKCIDTKEFELNKYTSISSKECVLEVDLEYPKELGELNNGYPLAPYKME